MQFCCFNSFCTNLLCHYNHFRPMEERELLYKIMEDTPEISFMKEKNDPKKAFQCAYGLRCFNEKCEFFHGINYDGRKNLIKKFNTQFHIIKIQEKIKNEIDKITNNDGI